MIISSFKLENINKVGLFYSNFASIVKSVKCVYFNAANDYLSRYLYLLSILVNIY